MIRVMVVEDEPAAMRYITSLICSRCRGMEIAAQAEDGLEAVEILKNTQIDILITDVQMAHMNGIELAQWASVSKPDVLTLIISGYGEFEYAKGAIQAGVAEYLLKPINPSSFVETMEKLGRQANQRRRAERERWLRKSAAGALDQGFFPGIDPSGRLLLGALVLGAGRDLFRPPGDGFAYPDGTAGELAAAYIHNESEICFARPLGKDGADPSELVALLAEGAPYHTALYKIIAPSEGGVLPDMLKAAKSVAVPGVSQILEYSGALPEEPEPSLAEQALVKQLRYAVTSARVDKIKDGLVTLFELWESENCRLNSAETTLTRLIQFMVDNAPPGHGLSQRDIVESVPALCRESSGFPDMLRRTWAFCGGLYRSLERQGESGQLINGIESYIRGHLGEPLSTQRICDLFGISGSYLSQLFRKYLKLSFVEYITELRVEEAKRMMAEHPDMPIKDIAAHLGFSDQFYFSKVFRSLTGMSPSEYKNSVGFSM